MNHLSKEKRTHLVLVILGILLTLAGIYYFLIREQQAGIAALEAQKADKIKKLIQIRDTFKNKKQLETDLAAATRSLDERETQMASGDLYAWMVGTLRNFKQPYQIDLPQIGSPVPGNLNILTKFPYRQAATTIMGSAYYHDLGRFVADFENQFPSARVLNLSLAPGSTDGARDQEKLTFKMDLVWLIKPDPARLPNTP